MEQKEFKEQWSRSKEYAKKLVNNMVSDGLTEREAWFVAELLNRELKSIRNDLSAQRSFTIPVKTEGDK